MAGFPVLSCQSNGKNPFQLNLSIKYSSGYCLTTTNLFFLKIFYMTGEGKSLKQSGVLSTATVTMWARMIGVPCEGVV